VHLNDIRDDEKLRVHFHPWPNALPSKSFGQAVLFWRQAIPLSMEHFFSTYGINEIIGDVSVNNKIANFCLKRLGHRPVEVVEETYIFAFAGTMVARNTAYRNVRLLRHSAWREICG